MAKRKKKKRGKLGIGKSAKKRAINRESTGGGWLDLDKDVEFFQPKKGINKFDILPYQVTAKNHPEVEKGDFWYQRTVWVHYNIGAEEKNYICPFKTMNKKCPICQHRAELERDPDVDEKIVKALRPREREIFNIRHDGEVKLMTLSYHNFGKMLEEEVREGEEDYENFAELEDGYTIKVRFGEEKIGTNKYLNATRIDFISRKDIDDSILDDVFDLDEILNVLSFKELKKIYFEADADEEDEDEEKKSKKKKRKKKTSRKSKRRSKKDDDDSSDDEDEDEEDDDSSNEDDDDEDDEDLDSDDDEDDDDSDEDDDEDDDEEDEEEDEEDEEDDEEEDDDDEDEEDDEEDEDDSDEEDCPYGHEFGVDTNDEDDCDDCENWSECQKAKDATKKKKKKTTKKKTTKKKTKKSKRKKK